MDGCAPRTGQPESPAAATTFPVTYAPGLSRGLPLPLHGSIRRDRRDTISAVVPDGAAEAASAPPVSAAVPGIVSAPVPGVVSAAVPPAPAPSAQLPMPVLPAQPVLSAPPAQLPVSASVPLAQLPVPAPPAPAPPAPVSAPAPAPPVQAPAAPLPQLPAPGVVVKLLTDVVGRPISLDGQAPTLESVKKAAETLEFFASGIPEDWKRVLGDTAAFQAACGRATTILEPMLRLFDGVPPPSAAQFQVFVNTVQRHVLQPMDIPDGPPLLSGIDRMLYLLRGDWARGEDFGTPDGADRLRHRLVAAAATCKAWSAQDVLHTFGISADDVCAVLKDLTDATEALEHLTFAIDAMGQVSADVYRVARHLAATYECVGRLLE